MKQDGNTAANYNCTFIVANTPQEVFESICNERGWWTANTEGNTVQLNDEFIVRFGETRVDFKIIEMEPYSKITWLVTDCYLHWLNDKNEWKNTKVNFDITEAADGTVMSMTHVGLTATIECYDNCKKGWDFFVGNSLKKLITEKKGLPDIPRAERIV